MSNNLKAKISDNTIGENIRFYRNINKMTLEQLADKIGITKQTMQKYESGAIKNITIEKGVKIADALGIDLNSLVYSDVEEKKSTILNIDSNRRLESYAPQKIYYAHTMKRRAQKSSYRRIKTKK